MSSTREVEFEQYVTARQGALLRTAFLLTGEQHAAEDLVQTALAKLYLAWHRVESTDSLDAYVRRIMCNEHTTWWRRAWRHRESVVDGVPERRDSRDATHELAERDALWSLVRTLPRRQRAAVVLRFYEDMSEADVADALRCSVGTVKSQTSRALATLRARMDSARKDER